MSSAADHIINFICTSQQEWAGAQAFGDFDLYLALFVHIDELSPKKWNKIFKDLFFNFNFPSRFGSQSLFVNVTLNFSVNGRKQEVSAIIGGEGHGTLGDYIEEAAMTAYVLPGLCILLNIHKDNLFDHHPDRDNL